MRAGNDRINRYFTLPEKTHDVMKLNGIISFLLNSIHAALVLAMFWWGIILILPVPTFSTSQSYFFFVQHWPFTEDAWALMFFAAAIIGLPGFISRNKITFSISNVWFRIASTTLLAGAHGFVAYATVMGNIGSTGTGIYIILASLGLIRIIIEGIL